MTLLQSILGGVQGALLLVGAALAAIFGAYWKGRSAGKAKERARQAEQSAENLRTRDEVEDENAALGDAAVRERLRDWER